MKKMYKEIVRTCKILVFIFILKLSAKFKMFSFE